ncbi:structural protein [Vibrio panuliri]|uniref:Structural protein P5 n=2 Tax=Vibrio panuliri TaxID=1381081 RepID=A0ABX3FFA5_9VIBR|nr:structural protein [Vibrio panuliri]OLQ91495.1 hypothetical protein BIY20_01075 [Vibrio panuliri]
MKKTLLKPRGFRNNNPLNIDFNNANNWSGQVGIETGVSNPRFAKFSSMEYGVRAAAKLIQNYMRRYNLKTVSAIINRWAPSIENDTNAYAEHVASKLGVSPYAPILESDIPELLYHMIKHENGQYLDRDTVNKGARLAGIAA